MDIEGIQETREEKVFVLTSNMLIIQKIDLHTLAKYWHLIGNMHTNTKETYLVIGVQKRTLWVEKLLKDGLNYAKKKIRSAHLDDKTELRCTATG